MRRSLWRRQRLDLGEENIIVGQTQNLNKIVRVRISDLIVAEKGFRLIAYNYDIQMTWFCVKVIMGPIITAPWPLVRPHMGPYEPYLTNFILEKENYQRIQKKYSLPNHESRVYWDFITGKSLIRRAGSSVDPSMSPGHFSLNWNSLNWKLPRSKIK